MIEQKLKTIFAWAPFGLIQIGDWGNWLAEQAADHPDIYELFKKIVGTVICATLYHFVTKFWKNREKEA
ncbi:hypothetical protein OB13_15045 [Pontibacter sp. HJ8]